MTQRAALKCEVSHTDVVVQAAQGLFDNPAVVMLDIGGEGAGEGEGWGGGSAVLRDWLCTDAS